ncbi:GntR family transcriptional regulator, partial [Morganella morganii]
MAPQMTQFIESKRPYQEVGHALRQMITNMHYAVGDKLPPEREIAEML